MIKDSRVPLVLSAGQNFVPAGLPSDREQAQQRFDATWQSVYAAQIPVCGCPAREAMR